jgi:hypothetical protein
MRYIDSASGHNLDQVKITELVRDIPTDIEEDDCAIKMAAIKHG